MTTFDDALPLRPDETAPVTEWLAELRTRVEGWARGVKQVSSGEWIRLQRAVATAVSKERVQQVLSDFLTRTGTRDATSIETEVMALRLRILEYRRQDSIDEYDRFVTPPPQLEI